MAGIMEISSFRSFDELLQAMDDPFSFHQWPVNSLEDHSSESYASAIYQEDMHQPSSLQPVPAHKVSAESTQYVPNRPPKQHTTDSTTFHLIDYANPAATLKPKEEVWSLNFSSESVVSQSSTGNMNHVQKTCQGTKRISTNTKPNHAQDHILAERKRREKLSERFIALSALVPGLKKMDKASVLGDATRYMKQLQEKVKVLEEQQAKNKSFESVVFLKKHRSDGAENSCYDETVVTESLPEIEARFSNHDVLVNILCEKRKGMMEKTVAEIEKLQLSILSCNVMPFGDSALNITVTAQKDEDFAMSMKEVVKNLSNALKPII